MTTHISYETAKKLKEFLGVSAPFPMRREVWIIVDGKPKVNWVTPLGAELYGENKIPAYELHDILSKPLCEAFVEAGKIKFCFDEDEITDFIADWSTDIAYAYWNGGLPAVEKALCEMMEGK